MGITYEELVPESCKQVDGMGVGHLSWVPKVGKLVEDANQGNCSHDYLPWALVKVAKGTEAPVTRCAYANGLNHVSSLDDPSQAKSVFQTYVDSKGKTLKCRVPVVNRSSPAYRGGQASGSAGIGGGESRVVA